MDLVMIINSGKVFLAGSKRQEQQTKKNMEFTFNNMKEWMDSMHLKLNYDKKGIYHVWIMATLTKINLEPLQA